MSLFVEVESVERSCKVIINLDDVVEIAPLVEGGCALFFGDSAAVGGKTSYKVKDSYDAFKQFAMETVSAADVAAKVKSLKKIAGKSEPIQIPTL
jgi:hypothetical protein